MITGATDGIGLETAKLLRSKNIDLLLHGRNQSKLEVIAQSISAMDGNGSIGVYVADLTHQNDVIKLSQKIMQDHVRLDALINNAGVFTTPQPYLDNGHDIRFLVNTIAPYLLTQKLLPLLATTSRVINLSSAAQSSVDLDALSGKKHLSDNEAYAQSKLALTMWSIGLANNLHHDGPAIIAINPASKLGSKMVQDAYGIKGADLSIGAEILVRAALDDDFANASGKYFNNDIGEFDTPHPDATNPYKNQELIKTIDGLIKHLIEKE